MEVQPMSKSNTPPALLLGAGVLVAFSLFVLPVPGHAQLTPTAWNESLSFSADQENDSFVGVDPDNPEPQSGSLSGSSWSLDGSISFGPAGPPQATSMINGSYNSGLTGFMGGTAYVRIDFEWAVRQTATPPVSVNEVPVKIEADGKAEADGDAAMFAVADADFNIATISGPLMSLEALVDNSSGSAVDSFEVTTTIMLAPDAVVFGDLTANANIAAEVLQGGTSSSATAFIDPVFEVSDDLIPGTSSRYKDFFEVEFGAGYYALGNPTPVETTTWGKIKSLYGN
jgi:hypothetical protein